MFIFTVFRSTIFVNFVVFIVVVVIAVADCDDSYDYGYDCPDCWS